jgi:hypothetical protein
MTCNTVRIKADNDQGHIVINESDFDPTKHELFAPTPPADLPPPPVA